MRWDSSSLARRSASSFFKRVLRLSEAVLLFVLERHTQLLRKFVYNQLLLHLQSVLGIDFFLLQFL